MAPYNSACLSAVEKETTLTMLLDSGGQIERLIITNGGNYSNMRHHLYHCNPHYLSIKTSCTIIKSCLMPSIHLYLGAVAM